MPFFFNFKNPDFWPFWAHFAYFCTPPPPKKKKKKKTEKINEWLPRKTLN